MYTMSVDGGDVRPIAAGEWTDWNPVWSPDGRFIYFSSNRGGPVNLWRVRVDEESGNVLASPEPVTTPATWSGFVSFSSRRSFAYESVAIRGALERVQLNETSTRVASQSVAITRSSREYVQPSLSPDDKQIVFRLTRRSF